MMDFIESSFWERELPLFSPRFYFLPHKLDKLLFFRGFFPLKSQFYNSFHSSCRNCFIHITSSFTYLFITTVSAMADTHIYTHLCSQQSPRPPSLPLLTVSSLEIHISDVDLSLPVLVELASYWMMHILPCSSPAVWVTSKAQQSARSFTESIGPCGSNCTSTPDGTPKTLRQRWLPLRSRWLPPKLAASCWEAGRQQHFWLLHPLKGGTLRSPEASGSPLLCFCVWNNEPR